MRLVEAVNFWGREGGEAELLSHHLYSTTHVFVVDSRLAAQAVASRHLCGTEKRKLFRAAVADAWKHNGDYILGNDWPEPLVECVILRGADHVRPSHPGQLIGRTITRTAIRLHRSEVSPGNWAAVIVQGESENTDALFASRQVILWDGCSASGCTLKAAIWLLRQNRPDLASVLIVCPFMGGLALRRVAEQARELNIHLTVLCFGVYRVAPVGWLNKTETDIYIPLSDAVIDQSHSLAIPERQRRAYRALYQPREISSTGVANSDDGFCLVGDVGESMAAASEDGAATLAKLEEQLRYVDETIDSWPIFCQNPIPAKLRQAGEDLKKKIAALNCVVK